jgi:hypothetical protein
MTGPLTEWFPSTVKPALPGWYNVKCANGSNRFECYEGKDGRVNGMRFWDGSKWLFRPNGNATNFGEVGWLNDYWRGLTEPAKHGEAVIETKRRGKKT